MNAIKIIFLLIIVHHYICLYASESEGSVYVVVGKSLSDTDSASPLLGANAAREIFVTAVIKTYTKTGPGISGKSVERISPEKFIGTRVDWGIRAGNAWIGSTPVMQTSDGKETVAKIVRTPEARYMAVSDIDLYVIGIGAPDIIEIGAAHEILTPQELKRAVSSTRHSGCCIS